jgi:hypothetical protein
MTILNELLNKYDYIFAKQSFNVIYCGHDCYIWLIHAYAPASELLQFSTFSHIHE